MFEGLRVDVGGVEAENEAEGEGEGIMGVAGKERDGRGELVQVWQTFRGNEWDNKGEMRGVGRGRVVAEVRAVAGKEYYQERSGCKCERLIGRRNRDFADGDVCAVSVLSFLKSPMILMALFSLGLIVGMPYLMENSKFPCSPSHSLFVPISLITTCTMNHILGIILTCASITVDPETRAEFEEMQKKSPLASANNPAAQLQNFDLASWMAGKSTGADEDGNGGSSQARRR